VRLRLGAPTFEAWFRELRGRLEAGRVVVLCPDRFSRDWIRARYGRVLEDACPGMTIEYRVEPVEGPEGRASEPRGSVPGAARAPAPADESPVADEPTLESFVAGPANALALEAARAVSRGEAGRCSPLVLTGGSGAGKTHLCRGIRRALVAGGKRGVLYRSAEEFTVEVTGAMRTGRMEEVRRRYRREANVLILEDVEFLEGKRATQAELFHTLDYLIRSDRALVFSSSRPPAELGGLESGLRSRLGSGLVALLSPPETETRRRILRERAAAGGIGIPDDCLELLATRPVESVRDLLAGLNQVVARASLLQRPVSSELVREALSAVSVPGRRRSLEEIVALVASNYGTTPEALRARSRRRAVLRPRQLAMYLCRTCTDASLKEIGVAFDRDHTSVMHAVEVVERRIVEQPQLRYELEAVAAPLRR
jgi:chromosomal replication initiator protein